MKKEKLLAIALSASMVFGAIPPVGIHAASASATFTEPTLTTDVYDLDLDGNFDSVYEIENADQLKWFADKVNNGNGNLNAVLLRDIDLAGMKWTPIGVNYSDFTGIFDGCGYTIDNLYIETAQNGYNNHPTYDYQGLFGVIRDGAVVRNFTVKGEIVCTTGDMNHIGGAVGLAYSDSYISDIISYVDINDKDNAFANIQNIGGIVGQIGNTYLENTKATVEYCKYYGTIDMDTAFAVGGIVGKSQQYSSVSECFNYGDIGTNYIGHIGGIVGSAQTGTTVKSCANYGEISVVHHDCSGGIAGYANEYVTILGCLNMGSVSAWKSSENGPLPYIGGILGYVNNADFKSFTGNLNCGVISSPDGTSYCGALIGNINRRTNTSVITNNYIYGNEGLNAYGASGLQPSSKGSSPSTFKDNSGYSFDRLWYIIDSDVIADGVILFNEERQVNILIMDDCTLTANKGITATNKHDESTYECSLHIFAESEVAYKENGSVDEAKTTTGKIIANSTEEHNSGIGSDANGNMPIFIHGGIITATGGNHAAGIGCSSGSNSRYQIPGDIVITGGHVTATGGNGAAGIGGAPGFTGGNVYIKGGTVIANGTVDSETGIGAPAIGSTDLSYQRTDGATVYISGGNVTATASVGAAAIGSGQGGPKVNVNITGGTVKAVSPANDEGAGGAAIGGGISAEVGSILIGGSADVTATSKSSAPGIGCGSDVTESCNITVTTSKKVTSHSEKGKAYKAALSPKILAHLHAGTSPDTEKSVEYSNISSSTYTENSSVTVERCLEHAKNKGEYIDETTHRMTCTWCNKSYVENHSIDYTGVCACGLFGSVPYLDYDEGKKTFTQKYCDNLTVIRPGNVPSTLDAGWYAVYGNVETTSLIKVSGDVHLILLDSSHLNVKNSIHVGKNNSLTVYAQSQPILNEKGEVSEASKTGALTAGMENPTGCGIGTEVQTNGALTFNGGVITAGGGDKCAGIGSSQSAPIPEIVINGGTVYAFGGSGGAGIGAGYSSDTDSGYSITVNGGTVTAIGNGNAAGIGSAIWSCGGIISINGGTVTAKGGNTSAGIGTAESCKSGVEIYINGGTVNASASYGAGIGSGFSSETTTTVKITGGDIIANSVYGAAIGYGQRATGEHTVEITGGTINAVSEHSTGIGSSSYSSGNGSVTIDGGTVTASSENGGCGIGNYYNGADIAVTVNGGNISALGANYSSAIGSNSSITLNGFETITAASVAGIAFSMPPTINEDLNIRYSIGTELKDLQLIKYSEASGIFHDSRAIKLEICKNHEEDKGIAYKDENTHSVLCHICGLSGTEAHNFTEDGSCICGYWFDTYLDYNEETKELEEKTLPAPIPLLKADTTELTAGWYAVSGTLSFNTRLTVTGDVHLILADGADMTVDGGISVNDNDNVLTTESENKLTVYAHSAPVVNSDGTLNTESTKTGKLTSNANSSSLNAGIGGDKSFSGGQITVNGGILTATGGGYAAAIGGGGLGSNGGIITLNGGYINAQGHKTIYGVGIGGGHVENGSSGIITVNGGTIFAHGGDKSAGIGALIFSEVDLITVNGGTVYAYGGMFASGIGCGRNSYKGKVIFNGGTVYAYGGSNDPEDPTDNGGKGSFGIGASKPSEDFIIEINGITSVTAVGGDGCSAFSNAPQIKADLYLRAYAGSSEETLAEIKKANLATVTTENQAVQLTPCNGIHSIGYIDPESHGVSCELCGLVKGEAHTPDDNGVCTVCAHWAGKYLVYASLSDDYMTVNCEHATAIKSADSVLTDGWYVAVGNVTVDSRITVNGDVKLILADGATLTVNGGIGVSGENTFTVYAQSLPVINSDGTLNADRTKAGKLIAENGTEDNAAIGGDSEHTNGKITIEGGIINATSKTQLSAAIGGGKGASGGKIFVYGGFITAKAEGIAAAIGAGSDISDNSSFSSGSISVYKGTVNAESAGGAGIGAGINGYVNTVDIYGGTVTAKGGTESAGIGSGERRNSVSEVGGIITVNGGTVNAMGQGSSAGIGGGRGTAVEKTVIKDTATVSAIGGKDGAAIGNGDLAPSASTVLISGGTVNANCTDELTSVGHGIGGAKTSVKIEGGTVTAKAGNGKFGIYGDNKTENGSVYITGGTVNATGGSGSFGMGIGGTFSDDFIEVDGGKVTVCGGEGSFAVHGLMKMYSGTFTAVGGNTSFAFDTQPELAESAKCNWTVDAGESLESVSAVPSPTAETYTRTNTVIIRDGRIEVSYLDYDYDSGKFTGKTVSALAVTSDMTAWSEDQGWLVVLGEVTISQRVEANKNVRIILADNSALTVNGGIRVDDTVEVSSLTVYAQSHPVLSDELTVDTENNKTGILTVQNAPSNAAGIGTDRQKGNYSVTVNGGVLNVSGSEYGAAIGSGAAAKGTGSVTVNGGFVNASSGSNAAAIGMGYSCSSTTETKIAINGGTITAKNTSDISSIIGGGLQSGKLFITVNGGNIFAEKSNATDGAGIGSGEYGAECTVTVNGGNISTISYSGAGLGSGNKAEAVTVNINGGSISAVSAFGAGIGSGQQSKGGTVTVNGGTIHASSKHNGACIGGGSGSQGVDTIINGGTILAASDTAYTGLGGGEFEKSPSSVTINDFESLVVAGEEMAFSVTPLYTGEETLSYNIGTTASSVYPAEYLSLPDNFYLTVPAVEFVKCTHPDGTSSVTYLNDESHILSCKWCGVNEGYEAEAHTFNSDGECACGLWKGTYLSYDEGEKTHTSLEAKAKLLTQKTSILFPGKYIVRGNVTFDHRVFVKGNVELILDDNTSFTVDGGIGVHDDDTTYGNACANSLRIYARSNVTLNSDGSVNTEANTAGGLTVKNIANNSAGIGSTTSYASSGPITIDGGVIYAEGGVNSAGIGNTHSTSSEQLHSEDITVNGGHITAIGSFSSGIGCSDDEGQGKLIINGGNVTSIGDSYYNGCGGKSFTAVINSGTLTAYSPAGAFAEKPEINTENRLIYTGNTIEELTLLSSSEDADFTNTKAVRIVAYHEVISINISWSSMEFTYSDSQIWNPLTHSESISGWSTDGGVITVENAGNPTFMADFSYTSLIDGISGSFDKNSFSLQGGETNSSTLSLSGQPTEALSNAPIGTVNLRILRVCKVYTAKELDKALENGGYIKLMSDVTYVDKDYTWVEKYVALDMNGHTVTFDTVELVFNGSFEFNSGALIKNGTVNINNTNTAFCVYGSDITFEDMEINGPVQFAYNNEVILRNTTVKAPVHYDYLFIQTTVKFVGCSTIEYPNDEYEIVSHITCEEGVYIGFDPTDYVNAAAFTVFADSEGSCYTVIPKDKLCENGLVYGESLIFCMKDAKPAEAGMITIGEKKYYVRKGGILATGFYSPNGSESYFFNEKGEMQTGWITVDGKWCYFDTETGLYDKTKTDYPE